MIVKNNELRVSALAFPSNPPSGGSWVGVYGSEGMVVQGNIWTNSVYTLLPSWVDSVVSTGGHNNTWNDATTEPQALIKPDDHSSRIAACWYNSVSFTLSVNVNDSNPHQVAVYCLDWDTISRRQTMDVLTQSDGTVLESDNLDASFENGIWLRYTISQPVDIKATRVAGGNAVISGLFFDTDPPPSRGFRSPPFF